MPGPPAPRSAKLVIDQAIRENRPWERTLLGMTIGFALTGVGVLIVGAVRGDGLTAVAGAVAAALFWPTFRAAEGIRRANMRIRLMEVPLAKCATADEALEILRLMYPELPIPRTAHVPRPPETHA